MRARGWTGSIALIMILAGCSTAVSGTAVPVASQDSSAAATTASAPPTCTGDKVVAPKDAPFCYEVPAGFVDVSANLTLAASTGTSAKHNTGVEIATHDIILVSDYLLNVDSTKVSDAALTTMLDGLTKQLGASEFAVDGAPPQPVTIDGARGFAYHGKAKSGAYTSSLVFVFKGKHEVEINCQGATKQADIDRACLAVKGSLKIAG